MNETSNSRQLMVKCVFEITILLSHNITTLKKSVEAIVVTC